MPIRRRRPGVVDQSVPTATEPRRSGEASGGDSTSLTAGAMVSMKVPPSSAIVFSSQDALPDREEGAELKRRHYRNSNSNSSSASTPLIGHTPNGRRFAVPKTHDMVSSLFNPTKPKSHFDWVILFTLSLHAIVYLTFPAVWRWKFLLASFAFWRIAYNGGLGLILKWQSERRGLVNWFIRNGLLKMHYEDTGIADYNDGDDNNGKGPAPAGSASNPAVAKWLRQQLEVKMGPDYDFDAVPAEFNAWLLYRQLVDLVLLNDFFAYFFFCLCFVSSSSDMWWKAGLRQAAGWMLLAFNLWVKIDAHRVVKDYAWYWGDFFFLVDQSLTFDGVFEMAPHPMYSIGYAGYYGGSLITGSYTVFYVSLAAHLCQFLFLSLVENPHIEKTYERPPIALKLWRMKRLRSRSLSEEQSDSSMDNTATKGHDGSPGPTAKVPAEALALSTSFRNDLVIFKNLDLLRAADLMLVLLLLYGAVVPAVVYMVALRHSLTAQIGMLWLAVGQCLFWITFRTLGLGYILRRQSESQWVIRWFLRHGGTADEAFTSWRAIYNAALAMTYASFSLLALVAYFFNDKSREMASAAVITAASNTYADPVGFLGSRLLAPTLGVLLIAFHIWSSKSVYDALGDFGWFYGDFFVQNLPADRQKLAFTGVYRYLNNPEKVIGQAAFYGLALISGSWVVLGLAMTLQVANFLFLTY
ncbi:phosphatidylethanolamine N-methyltransferase, partial [Spiromyces aspiralis]